MGDEIVMLTWTGGEGYRFSYPDLTLKSKFRFKTFNGEGWGICYDGAPPSFVCMCVCVTACDCVCVCLWLTLWAQARS